MNENKKMINFDSRDWDSIRDTINKINEAGEMQFGKTSEGETIIFYVAKNDDDKDILKTEVFENTGWIRTNYYDPYSFTVEELYKKEPK